MGAVFLEQKGGEVAERMTSRSANVGWRKEQIVYHCKCLWVFFNICSFIFHLTGIPVGF